MNNQTNRLGQRRFRSIRAPWKRRCSAAAVWLLVFALAAGGFPAAVLGQELQALPQSAAEVSSPPEPPVYTAWEDFRSSFGSHHHALALEAESGAIAVDGSLADWQPYAELRLPADSAQIQMSGWAGPEDVSASVYMAYDNDYFYWAAKVTDNVHAPVAGSTMWRGDSIQFAFSRGAAYGPEYGINYMDGAAHIWRFSEGKAQAGADGITAAAVQQGNEITYEVRMPWNTIYSSRPAADVLPFTLLINDNDGSGRRGWVEWTAGIGKAKSPSSHGRVHLIPAGEEWSIWAEGPAETAVNATVYVSVYAVNWQPHPATLQLASDALGTSTGLELPGRTVAEVRLPFTPNQAGDYTLDFAVSDAAGRSAQTLAAVSAVKAPAEVAAMLDAVGAKLPGLESLLLACEAQGLSTDYERINYTVIKDFVAYGKEDIAQGRLSRAYYVAVELEKLFGEAKQALEGLLDGSRSPVTVPRYITGRPEVEGGSFMANTAVRSTGAVEERSVFFTGYGAFNKVREDIPKFQDLGVNAIQVEIGPRDVVLDKTDFINQYSVSRAGNVNATAAVAEGVSHSGSRSLRIANSSPYQSNVYINVAQTVAVEPSTTYQFKVWVKGDNAHNTWFPGGSSMKQRKSLPSGTYDWQEVTYEYTTGSQETSYKLMVVSENTGTIWVDDLWMGKAGSSVNLAANPGFEDLGGFSSEKEYVVSTKKIQSDIVQVLQNAAANQVSVNLLVSPHYFPAWALAKWPELGISSNGFIKFSVFHPMAQPIIEDYLRALIPLVEPYGSLHSITLTNESVYQTNKDPYALPFWHSYLSEVYGGDIAGLNRVYGSSYAAFSEVPMPANVSAAPQAYDYVLFNNDYFARWHEWMAGIIRELAPDLPVHAKIMGDPWGSLSWGVDIERFSEFSQINGNDNWNYINEGPKGFLEELSFYDMQTSFKKAPVFNSEHHVIADGDRVYTPEQAKHVRSVLWQSAIHGRGASTLWVWERTYDEASSREGSILHRPDAVAAAGRSNLDLNRLAREVTAFQNEQSQAAILYSTASAVFSGDYDNVLLRSYEALSYSGEKVGFISEKQAAGGGLSAYKLLVVPAASRVETATLAAIKAFQEQGGRVLVIGSHSLEKTPRGENQSAADRNAVLLQADYITAVNGTAAQLRDYLQPILADLNPGRLLLGDPSTGAMPYNVEWRSVSYQGGTLVNVVNYGNETVLAAVYAGGVQAAGYTNLITGEAQDNPVLTLEPLTPYLFRVE